MKKHPLWRKRLWKMLTDKELHHGIFLCGVFSALFGNLIGLIFEWSFWWTTGLAFGIPYALLLMACVLEVVYKEDVYKYDTVIEHEMATEKEQMEEQQKKQEEAMKERLHRSWKELEQAIKCLPEEEREVVVLATSLNDCLKEVTDRYPLQQDDRFYIEHTLPEDVAGSLVLFGEMNNQNRQEMRVALLDLLRKKQAEIQEDVISRYETQKKNAFSQQLVLLEKRKAL